MNKVTQMPSVESAESYPAFRMLFTPKSGNKGRPNAGNGLHLINVILKKIDPTSADLLKGIGRADNQRVYLKRYVYPMMKAGLVMEPQDKMESQVKKPLRGRPAKKFSLNYTTIGKLTFRYWGVGREFREYKKNMSFNEFNNMLEISINARTAIPSSEVNFDIIKSMLYDFYVNNPDLKLKMGDTRYFKTLYSTRKITKLILSDKIETTEGLREYISKFLSIPIEFCIYLYLKKEYDGPTIKNTELEEAYNPEKDELFREYCSGFFESKSINKRLAETNKKWGHPRKPTPRIFLKKREEFEKIIRKETKEKLETLRGLGEEIVLDSNIGLRDNYILIPMCQALKRGKVVVEVESNYKVPPIATA
jgi:hypothetical protein